MNCLALNCIAQADDAIIGLRSLVLNSGVDLGELRDEAENVHCPEELRDWRKWPEQQEG